MAMNTRDERLYHYQYRRPRLSNPTYNSSNLFDSLNMFVREDMYYPSARSYGRYSMPKTQRNMENYSQVIDYRTSRRNNDFSTILPPLETHGTMQPEKDRRPIQTIEPKGNSLGKENQNENLRGSRLSENVQNRSFLSYKMGDSLSRGLEQFQQVRK